MSSRQVKTFQTKQSGHQDVIETSSRGRREVIENRSGQIVIGMAGHKQTDRQTNLVI